MKFVFLFLTAFGFGYMGRGALLPDPVLNEELEVQTKTCPESPRHERSIARKTSLQTEEEKLAHAIFAENKRPEIENNDQSDINSTIAYNHVPETSLTSEQQGLLLYGDINADIEIEHIETNELRESDEYETGS